MAKADSTVTYKPVPGFPGYRVGDDGSVWSCLARRGSYAYVPTDVWRRLKVNVTRGYLSLNLYGPNGDRVCRAVHHLVLLAFVGPCPDGMEGCHRDDDRANNRLANLRWDTPKANAADRERNGKHPHGEESKRAKITDDVVRAIRADHATGKFTLKQLSAKYGPHFTQISNIVRRKQWAHVV